jgi:hypothetical protein
MIVLYIIGGILLFLIVLYILFVVFINVRRRTLLFKIGVYEALNEFVNTTDFIGESNYIGGDIDKSWLWSVSIEDDSLFRPKEIFISSLKLPRKKPRYNSSTYILACLVEKKDNKWVVTDHSDMEKETINALEEEHGIKIKRKKY